MDTTSITQSDFDKLALLDTEGWDHNSHYHGYLLKQLPKVCQNVFEIGCGTGSFSRLLSQHAEHVLAIDLSPVMIELAQQRSVKYSNIDFQVADAMKWDFPKKQFDCIVSIATLHHLPLEHILLKMKAALKPNGVLMVLDLYKAEGIKDFLLSIPAMPVHTILKLKHTGRIRTSPAVKAAWAAHGAHDTYLHLSEVGRICCDVLPGAVIKKHLLWRYSMIWKNRNDHARKRT